MEKKEEDDISVARIKYATAVVSAIREMFNFSDEELKKFLTSVSVQYEKQAKKTQLEISMVIKDLRDSYDKIVNIDFNKGIHHLNKYDVWDYVEWLEYKVLKNEIDSINTVIIDED